MNNSTVEIPISATDTVTGDTVTTNIGTDVILTSAGDDAITIDGAGNKTIDGGAGTDSLAINYSAYGVADFTVAYSSDYFHLEKYGDLLFFY